MDHPPGFSSLTKKEQLKKLLLWRKVRFRCLCFRNTLRTSVFIFLIHLSCETGCTFFVLLFAKVGIFPESTKYLFNYFITDYNK